jgi:hypothetical protein
LRCSAPGSGEPLTEHPYARPVWGTGSSKREQPVSDEGLRAALEARLESLPLMVHMGNDYPTQALPKAELLDLLAAHPPTRICGDRCRSFGVDLVCRKPIRHTGAHKAVDGATWVYTDEVQP